MGLVDSFKVVNPFDFACPACGARLTAGVRGRWILAFAIGSGAALGGYGSYLWLVRRLSFYDSYAWIALVFALLAVPAQWLGIRFADAKLRA